MRPVATFISFRLGGTDGVSIEASKWSGALESLGFDVRRVAGHIDGAPRAGDVVLPWMAIEPSGGAVPRVDDLERAVHGSSLAIFENICALPLNPVASRIAVEVAERASCRVLFHDHDLPSQRRRFAGISDLPPAVPGALHVTVNELSQRELAARGLQARAIPNRFDVDAPAGDRVGTRARLGIDDEEIVVLQPARAIERKNVPAAIELAEALRALLVAIPVRFWLTGPAEDGYGPTLDGLVAGASVPVTVGLAPNPYDAYAASDVVVFPSTWEGFGNPVVESVIARRPLVVGHYPVLDELLGLGFRFFTLNDPGTLARWLDDPDPAVLEWNLEIARRHCSLADLPRCLEDAFTEMGWTRW